jgi:hypothetical protein
MRIIALNADIQTGLLVVASSTTPVDAVPSVKRGDTVQFQITFYNAGSAYTLASGAYIAGVKKYRDFEATAFLAETETVTIATSKATFNLAFTATTLADALEPTAETLPCVLELQHTDDDGVQTLAAFRLDVLNDYVRGTEGSPAPSVPTYYTASEIDAKISIPAGMRLRVTEAGLLIIEESA